jgi:hypothetical protein
VVGVAEDFGEDGNSRPDFDLPKNLVGEVGDLLGDFSTMVEDAFKTGDGLKASMFNLIFTTGHLVSGIAWRNVRSVTPN